jgi:hypothetical protein
MCIKHLKRRCCYCRRIFVPDKRVGGQQKACQDAACRRRRKDQAQARWVKKNRHYFKGRYDNTRRWLAGHPGYLESYRQNHPEYVQKNCIRQKQRRAEHRHNLRRRERVDIQDTIITQPFEDTNDRHKFVDVDIQDAIRGQLVVPVYISRGSGPVDIQDKMVRRILSGYTSAIMITTKGFNRFRKGVVS